MLVYDISNKESFNQIKDYYCDRINELCKKEIPVILLGNKADKEEERQIQQEEGIKLAVSHNYKFKETSCKTNKNVAGAFEALIEMWNIEINLNNDNDDDNDDDNIEINNQSNRTQKSGGCC